MDNLIFDPKAGLERACSWLREWTRFTSLPVYSSSGENSELVVSSDKILIRTVSGEVIHSNSSNEYFTVHSSIIVGKDGISRIQQLDQKMEVSLRPKHVARKPYSRGMGQMPDPFWPPATRGWYGRVLGGKDEAIFTVQPVRNSHNYWLTVSDCEKDTIYESHMIQNYEIGVLELREEWELYESMNRYFGQKESDRARENVLRMLKGPPPPWEEIVELTRGVVIPDLQLGNNMQESLEPLVPLSFPSNVREELMAFLAWITRRDIPKIDPVDFFGGLRATPTLSTLIMGHIQYLIDDVEPPQYVRLMNLAERKQLELSGRPAHTLAEKTPWLVFWEKMYSIFPSWHGRVKKFIVDLNESDKVTTSLPVSRSAAKRSNKAWIRRFALFCTGVQLRVHVKTHAIGLRTLAYFGSAHRWPHKHMAWITRLGELGENPPHLQIMQIPPHSTERVRRVLPNIMEVAWSGRAVNLGLFSTERGWKSSTDKILESLQRKVTIRKLRSRYGRWKGTQVHQIKDEEAKVLDVAARTIDLADLEDQKLMDYRGLTRAKIKSVLTRLRDKRIVDLVYQPDEPSLVSLFSVVQGPSGSVYSLANAFLEHTPTSLVMIDDEGKKLIVLSRMPHSDVYHLMSTLPARAQEEGLTIRCLQPRAFWNYTRTMYQRLLRDDGTWDDDVSGFLSQVRSMKKTLSEGKP
ncbi:MAG: hypothetical protein ACXADD_08200 [Candidatus Thorarchaeota archaeon]